MEWIIHLPVLVFSVVVHEFCHGWAALSRGDDTAQRQGRLTLDPLAHMDPFGTLFVPVLCALLGFPMLGWARPSPVDASRLKDPVRDAVLVALAGPAANLALAAAFALAFKLAALATVLDPGFRQTLLAFLRFGASANLLLAFFTLALGPARRVRGLLAKRGLNA